MPVKAATELNRRKSFSKHTHGSPHWWHKQLSRKGLVRVHILCTQQNVSSILQHTFDSLLFNSSLLRSPRPSLFLHFLLPPLPRLSFLPVGLLYESHVDQPNDRWTCRGVQSQVLTCACVHVCVFEVLTCVRGGGRCWHVWSSCGPRTDGLLPLKRSRGKRAKTFRRFKE